MTGDNPNWKTFLDAIPPEFHPVVKPILADWDKGVQDKIQSLHQTYEPYKAFVDQKVNPEVIGQALDIYSQVTQDPAAFIKKVDEVYELKVISPQTPQAQSTDTTDDYDLGDLDMNGDITKHPAFQQITQALEQLQGQVQSQTQKEQEEQEQRDFENYLNTLDEKYKEQGGINKMLVTAYMSQGLDGDAAVAAYQKDLTSVIEQNQALTQQVNQNNGQQDQVVDNPPAVMGSSGTAGSGLPDRAEVPSTWSVDQTSDIVAEMLKAAAEQQSG